jgi:hypothetical protein
MRSDQLIRYPLKQFGSVLSVFAAQREESVVFRSLRFFRVSP